MVWCGSTSGPPEDPQHPGARFRSVRRSFSLNCPGPFLQGQLSFGDSSSLPEFLRTGDRRPASDSATTQNSAALLLLLLSSSSVPEKPCSIDDIHRPLVGPRRPPHSSSPVVGLATPLSVKMGGVWERRWWARTCAQPQPSNRAGDQLRILTYCSRNKRLATAPRSRYTQI